MSQSVSLEQGDEFSLRSHASPAKRSNRKKVPEMQEMPEKSLMVWSGQVERWSLQSFFSKGSDINYGRGGLQNPWGGSQNFGYLLWGGSQNQFLGWYQDWDFLLQYNKIFTATPHIF